MNGVQGLAEIIRRLVRRKQSRQEEQVRRGVIKGGRVVIGASSYPFRLAVDCNTGDGSLVWVLLTRDGTAVVVGA